MNQVFGLRLLAEPRVQRAGLIVVLGLVLVVRLLQFLVYSTQIQWGYDFSAYWMAARNVLDGAAIYSPDQLTGPYSPQQQFLYLYPPFFAVVMTPFGSLFADYRVANWLWAALGAVVLVLLVRSIDRRESLATGRDGLLLIAAAFAFPPIVGELVMGNVHVLVLGLMGGAWLALRRADDTRRSDLVAGVLIGLATLIKIFPGVLILWLVLRRRWTAAAAAVVAMTAAAAATLPVIGLQPWLDYPTVLINLGAPTDTNDTIAPAVWLGVALPPLIARASIVIVGVTVVLWTARNRVEPVSYAVAVVVSVLIAPALYHHYLAILVLPMLLAIRWAAPIWWLAVAYILMSGGEQEALGSVVWVINRVLPTVGAALVLVGLVARGQRLAGDSTVATGR